MMSRAFAVVRTILQRPPALTRQLVRCTTSQAFRPNYDYKKVDEGLRLGDYPVLPWQSAQERPPRGWWDQQDRRNKEDVLHEEEDILNMWVMDAVECNGIFTKWEALAQLLTAFSILGLVYYFSVLYDGPSRKPCVPRQFPYNNLYLSRGGDPNKNPKEEKDNRVRATYGELLH